MEHEGDGHEENPITTLEKMAAEGAAQTMQELTESGFDSYSSQQKLGVLQRIVTAVSKDEDYRQILLLAAFDNKQEAMLAADAITERQRYGVSIQPILDRIVAQCSVRADRVDRVLHAMTNYTLNTNYGRGMPGWKKKQDSKSIS